MVRSTLVFVVLALGVSGCVFDLNALRAHQNGVDSTAFSDSGPVEPDSEIEPDVGPGLDGGSGPGLDAPPSPPDAATWVNLCTVTADCCVNAVCTPTGGCISYPGTTQGNLGTPCLPGFLCYRGLRCVGTAAHAWERTCEVDPDPPPPTVPPGC